jgi:hypothetical protein
MEGPPPPVFFVSVACKEVAKRCSASVDSRRFAGGRFRVKHGKTRCWFVSVASKGDECGEDETRNWKYEIRRCGAGGRVARKKQILRFARPGKQAQDDNFLGGPWIPYPPPPPNCRRVRKRLKTKGRENGKTSIRGQRMQRRRPGGTLGAGKAREERAIHGALYNT